MKRPPSFTVCVLFCLFFFFYGLFSTRTCWETSRQVTSKLYQVRMMMNELRQTKKDAKRHRYQLRRTCFGFLFIFLFFFSRRAPALAVKQPHCIAGLCEGSADGGGPGRDWYRFLGEAAGRTSEGSAPESVFFSLFSIPLSLSLWVERFTM